MIKEPENYFEISQERLDNEPIKLIGEYIRYMRKTKGMTIQQLAEASGVDKMTISQIETGKRTDSVRLGTIQKLLKSLGVSFEIGLLLD
jgi:transcriptional regulator with XRE-family HTH domain